MDLVLMIFIIMLVFSASAWALLPLLREFSSSDPSYRAILVAVAFTGLVTWMAVQTGIVTMTGIRLIRIEGVVGV
ncbi:hypothetical protein PACID_18770 [Acidipropionibacterium acidipropionici ATCC 4875]|uniref:Uncharacterized protein n=1 Tax=Acidipropionibacterium acidipropionici (strain ATCC 4875 / DSM 20272 / JCM 6432 / NBRC 12425 / NCIMB 8070 / 4) TaxID=1171373 RepID=K7RNU6_ACIA4|nr:hypothetical protein PACID_18770 [Acidipropionibacterium acidipropionici ATCC 4875]